MKAESKGCCVSRVERVLCFDEFFKARPAFDDQGGPVNLDEVFLLQAREKTSDGLPRHANYPSDLFMCERQSRAKRAIVADGRI
jgi:hypothetical protein